MIQFPHFLGFGQVQQRVVDQVQGHIQSQLTCQPENRTHARVGAVASLIAVLGLIGVW